LLAGESPFGARGRARGVLRALPGGPLQAFVEPGVEQGGVGGLLVEGRRRRRLGLVAVEPVEHAQETIDPGELAVLDLLGGEPQRGVEPGDLQADMRPGRIDLAPRQLFFADIWAALTPPNRRIAAAGFPSAQPLLNPDRLAFRA